MRTMRLRNSAWKSQAESIFRITTCNVVMHRVVLVQRRKMENRTERNVSKFAELGLKQD